MPEKLFLRMIPSVLTILLIACLTSSLLAQVQSGSRIPDQYIVILRDSELPPGLAVAQARARVEGFLGNRGVGRDALGRVFSRSVRGFSARLNQQQLARLQADPGVAFVEPDRVIVLAPPRQGRDKGTPGAQKTPWGISRVGGAGDGTAKTVWVIDTGVDLDHPDLKVDGSRSATFITKGKDSRDADDGNGHGTHVAGTIAALNNSVGVVGVAAGATVVGVKVLDSRGSGSYSGVIAGIDYVAANASPGNVVNMSLGGPSSEALDAAVKAAANAGLLFALAAGNESADANKSSPARVEVANVWTVSACDSKDNFASFSNYSGPVKPPVEFCAPGVDILSTWKDGGYNSISGTSMASPHVAGLLLLTGGNIKTDGFVKAGDPDGDPDPIAHRQ